MGRHEILILGEAASRALNDDAVLAAFTAVEADCANTWARSGPEQSGQREDAYRMHRCVEMVRQKLESFRQNAAIERSNSERDTKPTIG